MASRRRIGPLTLLVIALLVNLPVAHSAWTSYRLDSVGVEASATVLETEALPPGADDQRYFVAYRLPESTDPEQRRFGAEVDLATYTRAMNTGVVEVVVLPGDAGENRPVGAVPGSRLVWGLTIAADLALLAVAALMVWVRRTQDFVLVATEDVTACSPLERVEDLGGGEYVVCGDVFSVGDDEVVLAVQHRRIRVLLGDHASTVGHREPARARGLRAGRSGATGP